MFSNELNAAGIDLAADFHALSTTQVDVLVMLADQVKYRKPKNANGSRARYFFARLQRMKRRREL